ncbi:MAG: hypothetical protein FWG94_00190 [Oscillospiraceae bacterium]|nr:hypothetical protein [Oscillospiraceae bacterium]
MRTREKPSRILSLALSLVLAVGMATAGVTAFAEEPGGTPVATPGQTEKEMGIAMASEEIGMFSGEPDVITIDKAVEHKWSIERSGSLDFEPKTIYIVIDDDHANPLVRHEDLIEGDVVSFDLTYDGTTIGAGEAGLYDDGGGVFSITYSFEFNENFFDFVMELDEPSSFEFQIFHGELYKLTYIIKVINSDCPCACEEPCPIDCDCGEPEPEPCQCEGPCPIDCACGGAGCEPEPEPCQCEGPCTFYCVCGGAGCERQPKPEEPKDPEEFEGKDMTYTFNVGFDTLGKGSDIMFGKKGDELTELKFVNIDEEYKKGLTGYGSYQHPRQLGDVEPSNSIRVTLFSAFLSSLPNDTYLLEVWVDGIPFASGPDIIVNQSQQNGSRFSSRSSGSSGFAISATPAPAVRWLERGPAASLAGASRNENRDYVRTRHSYKYGVRGNAWDRLAGLRYEHDTMSGGAVQVRLYIDDPAGINEDILVSGYVGGDEVNAVLNRFDKFFVNKTRVVRFDHTGSWGRAVRVAARAPMLDGTGFDAENLYFYSYDRQSNKYRRIENPAHRIDKNGYLHFTTEVAGDIIISDGALQRR